MKVYLPSWIVERWTIVAYLVIPDIMPAKVKEIFKVRPNEVFYETVSKHLSAYLEKGTMPPEDIAPAIMNMADDHLAGNNLSMRAGDYIAIQNHIRRMG